MLSRGCYEILLVGHRMGVRRQCPKAITELPDAELRRNPRVRVRRAAVEGCAASKSWKGGSMSGAEVACWGNRRDGGGLTSTCRGDASWEWTEGRP